MSHTGQVVMSHKVLPGSILGLLAEIGRNLTRCAYSFIRRGSHLGFLTQSEFEELIQAEPSLVSVCIGNIGGRRSPKGYFLGTHHLWPFRARSILPF